MAPVQFLLLFFVACVANAFPVDLPAVANSSCWNDHDAAVSVNISNATAPFTFSLVRVGDFWQVNGSNDSAIFGIDSIDVEFPSSWFNLTVTDATNSVGSARVQLFSPAPLATANLTTFNSTNNQTKNGFVSFATTGGTAPILFWITNSDGRSQFNESGIAVNITGVTESPHSLPAGNYSLLVTDANQCTATSACSVGIDPLSITATVRNASCVGSPDGEIKLLPTGGYPLYTVHWAEFNTSAFSITAANGTYALTLTDSTLHSINASFSIGSPLPITAPFTVTNASSMTKADGAITIKASGGVSPYEYRLFPTGKTNYKGVFDQLMHGEYSVTVMDAHRCSEVFHILIDYKHSHGHSRTLIDFLLVFFVGIVLVFVAVLCVRHCLRVREPSELPSGDSATMFARIEAVGLLHERPLVLEEL